ncbi:MAG: cation:proton antiporter, partial [Actinomycetia bacterium]|nr:cation:proton antiporter [Actinomycetes bacterium]
MSVDVVAAAAGAPGIADVLLEVGAVLFVLGILGGIARRAGLSPVPLYLLAGLVLGEGGAFSLDASTAFLSIGAEIGLILLLLTLGLEFSADEFASVLRRHVPSGVVDLVLNATPGAIAGWWLFDSWTAALVMAGVTWVSSSGIVARVLNDLGRLANRETPSVLAILVLEDIAMAVYLPLVAVLVAGGGPLEVVIGVGASVTAVLVVLVGSRRFGDQLSHRLTNAEDEQVLLRVFGITLVVAGLTTLLDASAAVGAFLVGLALTGQAAERSRALLSPLRDVFAAVFFVSFGLSVDPSTLPPVLLPAATLALITLATKVATGWYAAGRDGAGPRGRMRAGLVLSARGEFAVVIAGVAVASGLEEVGPRTPADVRIQAVVSPIQAPLAAQLAKPIVPP